MHRLYMACLCFFTLSILKAQQFTIPGCTGYAVPAERENETIFSEKNGLRWRNPQQQISYFFFVRQAGGRLHISLKAKNKKAGGQVKLSVAGKTFLVNIPAADSFRNVIAGSVMLKDSGFYAIELKAVKKAGTEIANIAAVQLTGDATIGMHANLKPRRNAASVHLHYQVPDTVKGVTLYNELTVPHGADPIHSYYMACGFSRGYFGIQVNSATERRVIFSVWDAGKETIDRSKVADFNKVQLVAKGEDVYVDGFGNEGTGGHSHWIYEWKTGETYKFAVTALPDSATKSTIYTGYIYLPERQRWKLIAAFKAPGDGDYLRAPYSFVENFDGVNGQLQRKLILGNQWMQHANGNWTEFTGARFTCDATGRAQDRIDWGGGTMDGTFYLVNGGFQSYTGKHGDIFSRPAAVQQNPVIDWSKNLDSTLQAKKDLQLIYDGLQTKKIDTTGSVQGVFYKILKQGTGAAVSLNDTVTVYYKGSLLRDGTVFDQTKDKPISFPLKRLIKGWQLGVPMCQVGGKIRLVIPSALAYSIRTRSKTIPPNSVLVFDIDVVAIKAAQ